LCGARFLAAGQGLPFRRLRSPAKRPQGPRDPEREIGEALYRRVDAPPVRELAADARSRS